MTASYSSPLHCILRPSVQYEGAISRLSRGGVGDAACEAPGMTADVRPATPMDLDEVRRIYNQGIADRSTLDVDEKSDADIASWFAAHDPRYIVLVAERDGLIAGWASLNRYSPRKAHAGVADLSIYVDRPFRRTGVGAALMSAIVERATRAGFDKVILMTFPSNRRSRSLFERCGFREIGTFKNQGRLDGRLVDTLAMEKLLALPDRGADTG
jgi:L-amino acid N-acyltransferase YncA